MAAKLLELIASFTLELDSVILLELDSAKLLELGTSDSDELRASSELDEIGAASEELLISESAQPSGGQTTPYKGCVAFSLVQLAQKKADNASANFLKCL